MDPLIREDDKSAELVRPFDKLRARVTKVQSPKVQMEWLQWGFPMATTLSLNTLASINRNKAEELATDEHGKTRKEEKNFNLLRKQRCKWSGCSGASPWQLLCLQTHPHQ